MANSEQHNGDNGATPPPSAASGTAAEAGAAKPAFAGAARRRFATKGAAAVGAILTVKSQPGMACSICHSPSGFASGNLNSRAPEAVVCEGLSPGYWKNHTGSWHSSCAPSMKFQRRFNCSSSSGFYNKSMLTMLSHQDCDQDNVAMHIVAAYQNALKGYTSFLKPDRVQAIWNEYWRTGGSGRGYYTPMAGKKWYGPQIVAYLRGTMD
ncbi:hypothetical protein ASD15_20505 [Massilia sp. Root351]|uniref:hypothetical protein n=1 Tax=Massilia sp. Root351 TaxID=1736522 RepID=UPI00070E1535|nr:hypothetical protein [Massilia sp. Root351]KQV79050.1 hypothetical protein ASD15_20505 [Massilia sp. Root351]